MEEIMSKIYVIYWSGSGNTQAMAEAITQGITDADKEAELVFVSDATTDMVQEADVLALGCSAMGAEVLEEGEMEPFVSSIEGMVGGKQIALFGSYGWGDGQWMRDWEERMVSDGATLVNGEGLICNEAPDEQGIADCVALGQTLASLA